VRIHMQILCTRTRVLTFQFTTINTFLETAVCKLVPGCNSYRTCRMLCILVMWNVVMWFRRLYWNYYFVMVVSYACKDSR